MLAAELAMLMRTWHLPPASVPAPHERAHILRRDLTGAIARANVVLPTRILSVKSFTVQSLCHA